MGIAPIVGMVRVAKRFTKVGLRAHATALAPLNDLVVDVCDVHRERDIVVKDVCHNPTEDVEAYVRAAIAIESGKMMM